MGENEKIDIKVALIEARLSDLDEVLKELRRVHLRLAQLQELEQVKEMARDHEQRLRLVEASMQKLLVYATLAAAVGSTIATTMLQLALRSIL